MVGRALRTVIPPCFLLPGIIAILACSCELQPERELHRSLPWMAEDGHVISGRVLDPQRLRPEDASLLIGKEDQGTFSSFRVPLAANGSFSTPPLDPGTYVLQVRPANRSGRLARIVGFTLVSLGSSDVTGVNVLVQPDAAVNGRFRMKSDNPAAPWPPHIVVSAFLALDGKALHLPVLADGAEGGRFILRNAFGPRVVRCGHTIGDGGHWWPDRVLLDGVDITNVPTDFSKHDGAELEIWFTQHPARVAGLVTDAQGRAVPRAWVLLFPEDIKLRQQWAASWEAEQASPSGKYRFCPIPGRYRLRALPSSTFSSRSTARQQISRYASGSVPVELLDRESKTLNLTCDGCR